MPLCVWPGFSPAGSWPPPVLGSLQSFDALSIIGIYFQLTHNARGKLKINPTPLERLEFKA